MIARHDLVDILLRQQVLGGHARLIFNERNGVLVVFSLEREVRGHHRKRDVAAHVEPGIVAASEMRHAADDFEPDAVQQDECSHRRAAGK